MQKKADVIADSADMTEREKAASISKMVERASKEPKRKKAEVKVVVARGINRGRKGRPAGVKGRYKVRAHLRILADAPDGRSSRQEGASGDEAQGEGGQASEVDCTCISPRYVSETRCRCARA